MRVKRRNPLIHATSETSIYIAIAKYLNTKYSGVIYHFDLSGVHNSSVATRSLYSNLNGRAWPDLEIAEARSNNLSGPINGWWCGLYLEIKVEGTKLKREKDQKAMSKDDYKLRLKGDWYDVHIEEQALMLEKLREKGYAAEFGVGFNDTIKIIDNYLQQLRD